jgi:phosphoglycolate phosphatase-like HAD superfamily hydrolase
VRPTVFLFDIDGTLISTGGAGRRSMVGAFHELHGARGVTAVDFPYAGMTDRAIVRGGLRALEGHAADDDAIDRLLELYLGRLADELARSDGYRIHPGVATILEWLPTTGRAAIGLGTGNVRKGAYAKLARGALDGAFTFGGFGCDAEDRTQLLRVGAERGAAALGVAMAECRVVVIGDTPKDVAAALGIGADCIAVGTGGFDPRALLELGAFAAFATLAEERVREALLDAASQGSETVARSSGT